MILCYIGLSSVINQSKLLAKPSGNHLCVKCVTKESTWESVTLSRTDWPITHRDISLRKHVFTVTPCIPSNYLESVRACDSHLAKQPGISLVSREAPHKFIWVICLRVNVQTSRVFSLHVVPQLNTYHRTIIYEATNKRRFVALVVTRCLKKKILSFEKRNRTAVRESTCDMYWILLWIKKLGKQLEK